MTAEHELASDTPSYSRRERTRRNPPPNRDLDRDAAGISTLQSIVERRITQPSFRSVPLRGRPDSLERRRRRFEDRA